MTLAEDLAEWTDVDGAQHALGKAIGVFTDAPYLQIKFVFWSDNPVGNALGDMLMSLAKADVLEYRDEPDFQFRWSPRAPIDGRISTTRTVAKHDRPVPGAGTR